MRFFRPASLFTLSLALIGPSCRSTPTFPDGPRTAPFPASGLTFTGRLPHGREIALSDRTKWSIQPAGASATLRWQPGEPLRLGASGEPTWPAAITSLATGATAFARSAGQF